MRFVALMHKEPETAFGVSFPDVPGCVSAGDTIDEATANAADALSGHCKVLEADGDTLPSPRTLDEIIADPTLAEDRRDAALVLVPLIRDAGKTASVRVTLDTTLLRAVDAKAQAKGIARSEFMAVAARKELRG